ncbi:MAG: hypothetical protein KA797_07270 [Chitinophagales bacterium]|nr:hypothetical protein [Chitinophagales bacterium]
MVINEIKSRVYRYGDPTGRVKSHYFSTDIAPLRGANTMSIQNSQFKIHISFVVPTIQNS